MQVREVMSKKADVINMNRSVVEAAKMMKDGNYGSIPVEDNDRLQGMVTDRDIAVRVVSEGLDPNEVKVSECMSKGVEYCFDDESLEDISKKMAETRYRRLPVLNRDKRLVGIVSLGDLSRGEKSKTATHEALQQITSTP